MRECVNSASELCSCRLSLKTSSLKLHDQKDDTREKGGKNGGAYLKNKYRLSSL